MWRKLHWCDCAKNASTKDPPCFFFKCPSIFHNWWQCSRGKCESNWSTDLLHFFTRWEWGRAQWWHDFFRIGGMDSEFSRFPRFWAIDLVQLEIHTNPARNFMDSHRSFSLNSFCWLNQHFNMWTASSFAWSPRKKKNETVNHWCTRIHWYILRKNHTVSLSRLVWSYWLCPLPM